MANFGLRVAANNIKIEGAWKPLLCLLFGAEGAQGISEHAQVESKQHLSLVRSTGPLELRNALDATVECAVMVEVEAVSLLHPSEQSFFTCLLVKMVGIAQFRILFHISDSLFSEFSSFLIGIKLQVQLLLIKVTLGSLLNKFCSNNLVLDAAVFPFRQTLIGHEYNFTIN